MCQSTEADGGNARESLASPGTTKLAVLSAVVVGAALLLGSVDAYDVAATTPHARPVAWILREGMEHSIRKQARAVSIPEDVDLQDPALAERAIGHYSVACASCHAAPGQPRAPWMVLYPEPADLTQSEVVSQWSDAELYWVIKHGVKDTGMIALGPTHAEEDLWAVSAFVRQLPAMSAERYQQLVADYQAKQRQATHADPASHGSRTHRSD